MLPYEKFYRANISEYIIHLYKTEALIRSFDFDLNEINRQVIQNIETSDSEKKQILLWYAQIISDMKEQGLDSSDDHLQETKEFVHKLEELHHDKLNDDKVYQTIFGDAQHSIEEHISLGEGKVKNPIQACLNCVFGMLLLRVQGKEVNPDQLRVIEKQADVLSYLSKSYNLIRKDL